MLQVVRHSFIATSNTRTSLIKKLFCEDNFFQVMKNACKNLIQVHLWFLLILSLLFLAKKPQPVSSVPLHLSLEFEGSVHSWLHTYKSGTGKVEYCALTQRVRKKITLRSKKKENPTCDETNGCSQTDENFTLHIAQSWTGIFTVLNLSWADKIKWIGV